MNKLDRFQSLHRILSSRRKPVSLSMLAERMECTEKTVSRIIKDMQNFFHAPIEYFPEAKGWHYKLGEGEKFELPGLWLTGEELQSLTLLLHVLEGFGNGLLNEELALMEKQIHKLLQARGISPSAFSQHIKVLPLGNKVITGKMFTDIGEALLKHQQIIIKYKDYSGKVTTRSISPQTLVHYRENWYLDAWCHLRNDLRTFSLARIVSLNKTTNKAKQISQQQLTEHFSASYGIFSGKGKHTATLRFLSQIAREISLQQWHPQQQGTWEGEEYLLSFPYSDERELMSDILRHVPHVMVEAPADLKKKVQNRLHAALELFTNKRIRRL